MRISVHYVKIVFVGVSEIERVWSDSQTRLIRQTWGYCVDPGFSDNFPNVQIELRIMTFVSQRKQSGLSRKGKPWCEAKFEFTNFLEDYKIECLKIDKG